MFFLHQKGYTVAGAQVSISFEGYFRNEIRFTVRIGSERFTFDVTADGIIRRSEALAIEFARKATIPFHDVASAVIAYHRECPPRSKETPPQQIMQPFHIHENPKRLALPGLEECHYMDEVVELIHRTWPGAEYHRGGSHLRIFGKYSMVIHETWDPQTCTGSEPPDPNAPDNRGWLARLVGYFVI